MIRNILISVAVLLCCVPDLAFAETPPLIPRKVLFGNPDRSNVRISPDGKFLAYLAPKDAVLSIWVRNINGRDDHVIARDDRQGIRSFIWQEDSRHILYDQDVNGNERWHFYQADLSASSMRDLTPYEGIGVELVALSPKFPNEMLVGMNFLRPYQGLNDVYRMNLTDGSSVLDTENPGDVTRWIVDNGFRIRAAQASLPDGSTEIRVRDSTQSNWRSLLKWGPEESVGRILGFTPDDKGLYLLSSIGADTSRLLKIDLTSGKPEVLVEDHQYDVTDWISNPSTGALEAVGLMRARREWRLVDNSLARDFEMIRKIHAGDPGIFSQDRANKKWIVVYNVDNGPSYYYLYDRAGAHATFLFSTRNALEGYTLARMQPIDFAARDGMVIHGYLTLPVNLKPRKLPMVVKVHGGPWVRDSWGLDNESQWLANRGYAVLQINYRGSTGFGKTYLDAGDREWGGKMETDLIDGKNWAVREGYADPEKVCIMGSSYGGYAALMALATTREFRCGVDLSGPSDLVTFLNNIPSGNPIKLLFTKRVGNADTEQQFLRSRSPLYSSDKISSPLLIAQGANDPRVRQSESDQMVNAIRKRGGTVRYLIFGDEGHDLVRAANRLKFYAAVEAFLAKSLGGRVEAATAEEEFTGPGNEGASSTVHVH